MAENSLVLLSKANQMLAEAKTIDEAKYLMDIASAAKHYAQKHKLGKEAVDHAREIEIRAEILLGEFLSKMEKNRGAMGIGKSVLPKGEDTPPTYKEVGITYKEASESQRLASLPEPEREKVIKGEINKSTVLRKARQRIEPPALPEGKYRVIYADPPWEYNNSGFGTSAANQYQTMRIEEICALPVEQLVDDNAVLFLWATNPLLDDAIKVCKTWGFSYKSNFVWVKNKHTGGFYCYGQHELLLIAIKGSLLPKQVYPSVITALRREHSRKPDEVYGMIEKMYDGPYVELFARTEREGWIGWGNEYGLFQSTD